MERELGGATRRALIPSCTSAGFHGRHASQSCAWALTWQPRRRPARYVYINWPIASSTEPDTRNLIPPTSCCEPHPHLSGSTNSLAKERRPILLLIYFWSSWSCNILQVLFLSTVLSSYHIASIPSQCPNPIQPYSQIALGRLLTLLATCCLPAPSCASFAPGYDFVLETSNNSTHFPRYLQNNTLKKWRRRSR